MELLPPAQNGVLLHVTIEQSTAPDLLRNWEPLKHPGISDVVLADQTKILDADGLPT